MKAKDLTKVPETIEDICAQISDANANKWFKCFIPHFIYVTNETKLQLMKEGFKVYEGKWDETRFGLIIEW